MESGTKLLVIGLSGRMSPLLSLWVTQPSKIAILAVYLQSEVSYISRNWRNEKSRNSCYLILSSLFVLDAGREQLFLREFLPEVNTYKVNTYNYNTLIATQII